jgi:PAS domain S-box-containing protein
LLQKGHPTVTSDTQLFRDVFNASPIGIVVENLEGQPLFVNPAFCSMLGFSEEEIRRKHCVDFSPPEDAEKDWGLFQQLRAGSIDHYQIEKRYFRRDGSLVWGRLSISLLNGRPSPLVLAMVEDITDKKTAEEARFRHAAVVESSEDAIISKTLDGIIVSWNPGAHQIYGYAEAEAVGKHHSILIPPELVDEEKNIVERLRAGERVEHYETVRVTKAGKRINVSLSVSPTKDSSGTQLGFCAIARDITEHKRAEKSLRESEEKFRRVFQDAATGMVMLSPEGRFLAINRAYCEFLGYSEKELIGRDIVSVTHPEDHALCTRLMEQALAAASGSQRYEKRYLHKNGQLLWGESGTTLICDSTGKPEYFVSQIVDITERKRAEVALAGMTRKLVEAQEQERARIARELHDDINQRLAILAIELEQLQGDPSDVKSRLQELGQQTIEISSDVQALSHDLHSSQLEYLGVVRGMKSWCREFGERQGIEIDCRHDVRSNVPVEVGLPLFRVLQEALHNAAKHSGVKRIEVRLHEQSDEIHLIVRDSGTGFDIGEVKQGNGLGLTSMRERVRLVNGTIAIDSKPMRGTSIHVRVPLEPQHVFRQAAG